VFSLDSIFSDNKTIALFNKKQNVFTETFLRLLDYIDYIDVPRIKVLNPKGCYLLQNSIIGTGPYTMRFTTASWMKEFHLMYENVSEDLAIMKPSVKTTGLKCCMPKIDGRIRSRNLNQDCVKNNFTMIYRESNLRELIHKINECRLVVTECGSISIPLMFFNGLRYILCNRYYENVVLRDSSVWLHSPGISIYQNDQFKANSEYKPSLRLDLLYFVLEMQSLTLEESSLLDVLKNNNNLIII
jgi:hypothetical protein